jgi:hypothetical protein
VNALLRCVRGFAISVTICWLREARSGNVTTALNIEYKPVGGLNKAADDDIHEY